MSNPAVQLTFTLRTSPNVRSVHLLGSWDNYKNQLPLSAVKGEDAKPGSWKGTFRFQGAHALKLGSRYWYYYCVDGYHVSHDPAKEFVVEPTTGRKLNVLDVPRADGKTDREAPAARTAAKKDHRQSTDIPKGRPVSPGRIQHPKPTKAYASRQIREADYDVSPVDQLEDLGEEISRLDLDHHGLPSKYSTSSSSSSGQDSDSDLSGSSGSFSGPYDRGSPGSFTSISSAMSCRCERYGVTRRGERVKLDCGGKVCGYNSGSDSPSTGSECSSDSGSDDEEERARIRKAYEAAQTKNRHAANGVGTKKVMEDRGGKQAAVKSSGRARR